MGRSMSNPVETRDGHEMERKHREKEQRGRARGRVDVYKNITDSRVASHSHPHREGVAAAADLRTPI